MSLLDQPFDVVEAVDSASTGSRHRLPTPSSKAIDDAMDSFAFTLGHPRRARRGDRLTIREPSSLRRPTERLTDRLNSRRTRRQAQYIW